MALNFFLFFIRACSSREEEVLLWELDELDELDEVDELLARFCGG